MRIPDGSRSTPAAVIAPGKPAVVTTFQLEAAIPLNGRAAREVWTEAIRTMLAWVQGKIPKTEEGRIPAEALEGAPFRLEFPGQWVEAAVVGERWALGLEQPDAPGPYRKLEAVPGRTWRTDLALVQGEKGLRFAVRVRSASLPYATKAIQLTRPRVVLDLASTSGLEDLRPLDGKPWRIDTDEDLEALHLLLLDPGRRLPVTMLTEKPLEYRVPVSRPFVLDHDALASSLQGLSHVVLMPREPGFRWTEQMGRRWTAFDGAVRTYRPGMNPEEDPPHLHPRVLLENILFWRHPDPKGEMLEGERAFAAFLKDRALAFLAERPLDFSGIWFLPEVRSAAAADTRKQAEETGDWARLIEEENAALRKEVEEARKEAQQFCDLASAAERQMAAVVEENKRLRAALDAARAALMAKTGEDPDDAAERPQRYEDIPTWVTKVLAGRLILHPRAENALKKAQYEDVGLVVEALLLLAREYRDARIGGGSLKDFEAKAAALHLRFSGSIEKSRAGQEGEEYFVAYPFGSSHRRFLECHLRKGSSTDPRRCLAIYFFWDDDTRQVVVGWLPSHLDNRMT